MAFMAFVAFVALPAFAGNSGCDASASTQVRRSATPAAASGVAREGGEGRATTNASGGGDRHGASDVTRADSSERSLTIATWNVQRLGHGNHRDRDRLIAVLEEFDLIAIQEVMTREAIAELVERMPGWQALLTDTPLPRAGSSHREYYAFLYRDRLLEPVLNTTVPDPRDAFVRDPFVGCFVLRGGEHDLCLMTVHVIYGSAVQPRKAEILALDDALAWAREARPEESDWIVLGDFNRVVDDGDGDRDPEEEWRELLGPHGLTRPLVLAGEERASTLGKQDWSHAYDHIFLSEGLESSLLDSGRVDIVERQCGGDFERCRRTLSDHAPLFVVLRFPKGEAVPEQAPRDDRRDPP
jgi:endonuclease/exonuclease/phosphatase family metal-dependent hydrolase